MNTKKELYRLYELALRSLEDVICDDEFAELNRILAENPEFVETYYDLVSTCSTLHRDLGGNISNSNTLDQDQAEMSQLWLALAEEERTAETIELPVKMEEPQYIPIRTQKVIQPRLTFSKFSRYSVAVCVAAIFLLVAYVRLVPVPSPSVAILTETYRARWSQAGDQLGEGDVLKAGYWELLSGYVRIELNSGASVIIEGPSKFELESESVLFLQDGKVSCHVPPAAVGFRVGTPTASVVDFGTDFGVIVKDSGRTEAHVFAGQVELRTGPDALVFDASRRLFAGQGGIVDENETLVQRRLRARQNEFIRTELIPYEIAVRESGPFSYWRFDDSNKDVFQDILEDRCQPCEFYGDVQFVPGPTLGKGKTSRAVHLDGGIDSYIYVPKAGDRGTGEGAGRDFSYSFWIRPDIVRAQDLISATNKGAMQYRHIGLNGEGRFTFFTYVMKNQTQTSQFSGNTIFVPDRWYHVVVTGRHIKGLQSEVCLYINGRKDASQEVLGTYSPRYFGNFYVGSAPEEGRVKGVHPFDGAITEIVEYDRALMPQEVQAIYSSVR